MANGVIHNWYEAVVEWGNTAALVAAGGLLATARWVTRRYRKDRGMLLRHEEELKHDRLGKIERTVEECRRNDLQASGELADIKKNQMDQALLMQSLDKNLAVLKNDSAWICRKLGDCELRD